MTVFVFIISTFTIQWHPDKNPGDAQATKNFQKISEAYATLSDEKKRKLYDQYGTDGVNAADQMGEDAAGAHFGGAGGMPHFRHSAGPGGGGGSTMHMSPEEAQAFFSTFFGHDDPFGGMFGGGPRSSRSSFGGQPRVSATSGGFGGPADPFSMMFGGGAPGMMPGMGFGGPGGPGIQFGGAGDPGAGMRFSGGGMPRQQRAMKRFDAIPNGTVVSLKGLISQPSRNGDRGEVVDFDGERYTIALEDGDELLRVKAQNLLQHVHVTLQGIESQPGLNGKKGTIIAWNAEKQRYNIYVMDNAKVVSLKPGNVILDTGVVGKIVGLHSKPELNDKFGTIKAYIRDSNRYDVQLSVNQVIRIKLENIHV
jgi:curved DNA-binding protein CbpA